MQKGGLTLLTYILPGDLINEYFFEKEESMFKKSFENAYYYYFYFGDSK